MNTIVNIEKAPCQTIADVVDEYFINRGITIKKNTADYLVIAKRVWQDIFWNTIWVVRSKWQTLQAGDPYPFIYTPKDCVRFFSVAEVDKHNKIEPLYYNQQINVIPLPASQKCGCESCGCTGAQDELSSLTFTSKLLFSINGIDYYEKDWIKYCSNGDILLYREVPTKKYNDAVGTQGDFNNDFNNDFSIQSADSANFEIVTEKFQEKICALTLAPCGCPEPTVENQEKVECFCGCFAGGWNSWWRHRHHENPLFQNINNNHRGEVKMSECGTKIYYIPSRNRHRMSNPLPKFLLVNYQTSGMWNQIDGGISVPDFAVDAMMTGIDWRSKRFNNRYGVGEKKAAEWAHNDAVNKLILFMNPISLDWLQNVVDREVRW